MNKVCLPEDQKTARAFADSWNHLPEGSVYTEAQFRDWMEPIMPDGITGKRVLELGCGNGSLMVHMAAWKPSHLEGVDLGDSIISARRNMELTGIKNWSIVQHDLTTYTSDGFDLVYCIGVLHHLKDPKKGLDAVIANTRKGGNFHCWVYAREGNAFVISVVDPLRRITSRLPWRITKYLVATPLAMPFYLYAKALSLFCHLRYMDRMPLYDYCLWIARREFTFFRHVAFDQLVTPQTSYISREMIEQWLASYGCIDKQSIYIIMRNGNSWKFGGVVR